MTAYAERMIDAWTPGEPLAVNEAMTDLTLEIVGSALLGVDVATDAPELGDAFGVVLRELHRRTGIPLSLPNWLPTPANRRFDRAMRVVDRAVVSAVRAHRRGDGAGPLVSTLLEPDENDERMRPRQLRDELVTFLVAGHETIAVALTFAWYTARSSDGNAPAKVQQSDGFGRQVRNSHTLLVQSN
ncbi:cytochrome P450 [Haloprofundus halobius]|uniref:cytochrome P450 n=1 Tax=Haloprofundus halobius TaxID=2876194 RepID=UPI0021050DF5|nr:cytochrome P450 [Haloprofundus halobius]